MTAPLLEVRDLQTHFFLDDGVVKAVDGVSFSIARGSRVGLVGESGCGKSILSHSLLKLVPAPGKIIGGEIRLARGDGSIVDIAKLPERGPEIRAIRGREVAMIFQEPMSSLSMYYTIGQQISEGIVQHFKVGKAEARYRAIKQLQRVAMPNAEERVDAYPFQLSGGMRQRAMIAMALACEPSLLIADEPTTALDVTTQAQILRLLKQLCDQTGKSMLMITHDLGVIAETCQRVVVMYLGIVAEEASVYELFADPLHPYTRALLHSIPKLGRSKSEPLAPVEGSVPDPYNRPTGCPFHTRCPERMAGVCDTMMPPRRTLPDGRSVACHLY
jgi:oligopeptide/dipeptide ABC transporter ATP-binding protein